MSNGGTQINELINSTQLQSKEDTSVVDSIINELNESTINKDNTGQSGGNKMKKSNNKSQNMRMNPQQMNPQQMNPQQMNPQQMNPQQMNPQQQQMYQQQMAAQQQKMTNNPYLKNQNNLTFADKVKDIMVRFKDVISVLIITIIFNLDVFNEPLKLKDIPLFYDIQKDKSKLPAILLKASIIAIIFSIVQYFIK